MNLMQTAASIAWRVGSRTARHHTTFLISGTPRGGTTWLLEILEQIPRSRRLWEPFYPYERQAPGATQVNMGLGLRPYLNPAREHPELEQWFRFVLSGRCEARVGEHSKNTLELWRRLATAELSIAKFCRLQRLLPWLLSRFDVKVVMLTRNPFAVVASQLGHYAFRHPHINDEHPIISAQVRREFSEEARFCSELQTLEEKLAATWCLDWAVPRRFPDTMAKILELAYEDLVNDFEGSLSRVESYLGVRLPSSTRDRARRPSATTITKHRPLKWLDQLDDQQIQRISRVVRFFHADSYLGDGF